MAFKSQKWLIGSASVIALGCFLATPAVSADLMDPMKPGPERTVSGTFDFYGGWTFADADVHPGFHSFDSDYPLLGGAGRVDLPWSENMSLQLDVEGIAAFTDGTEDGAGPSESDNYGGGAVAAAHLNYREVDQFLIGLFGGAGVAAVNDTNSTGQDPAIYFVGVEGQMYFGDITLYGQVGYLDSDADATNEALSDAVFVRGVGRFYFGGGHTMLEGEVSYTSGDQDEGGGATDDVDIIGWGGQLVHQFHNWGNDGYIAGFLQYRGNHYEEDDPGGPDGETTEHTIMVGLTVGLNQYSLKTTERTGVALDLPDFTRQVSVTTSVDDD